MFKGITLESFNKKFSTEDQCKQYLFDLKWKRNYKCRRCGNSRYWKGRTMFHTRCTNCKFDESETAHTIFHKLQIPLLKAFGMAFQISVLKKGISSTDLARIFGVNQKTAWLFKRKAQEAMGIEHFHENLKYFQDKVSRVDGLILMNRIKNQNSLQRVDVIMKKLKSRSRRAKDNCTVLIQPELFTPCQLLNGHYVDSQKEILLWNFKQWLTGTHHHCSEKFLQGYVNEFFFRHNHRGNLRNIWHDLIRAMLSGKPYRPMKGVKNG